MAILARFLKADATEAVAMKTAWIPKQCLELEGQTDILAYPLLALSCQAKSQAEIRPAYRLRGLASRSGRQGDGEVFP